MPKKIKKTYEKKSFESTGVSSDTSANIYMSMLLSEAWRELTPRQHDLYLYCKAQYYAEKKKPIPDNSLSFTMNQSKWDGLYRLYTKSNHKYFQKDMDALIAKGFIKCLENGANTRTKSVYAFSDKWQKYGTKEFDISIAEMTKAMMNKIYKTKKEETNIAVNDDIFQDNQHTEVSEIISPTFAEETKEQQTNIPTNNGTDENRYKQWLESYSKKPFVSMKDKDITVDRTDFTKDELRILFMSETDENWELFDQIINRKFSELM